MRRVLLVLGAFGLAGLTSVFAASAEPLTFGWEASWLAIAVLAIAAVLAFETDLR